jgi:hypothetical protein
MQITNTSKYCKGPAILEFGRYPSGQVRIQMVSNDGEPLATCTSNVPEVELPTGMVIIKNL